MYGTKRTPPKPILRSEQSISEPDLAKHLSQENEVNVTMRKRKQPECEHATQIANMHNDLKKTLSEWKTSLDASLIVINDNVQSIRSDLENFMLESKKEINSLRSENITIKKSVSGMAEEVAEIKNTAQFISDKYDDHLKRLNSLEEQILHQNVIKALEEKIDNLEQQARLCNLEISNVPERRDENLLTLIENIGKKIDLVIPRADIITVHRVPHAASNDRPKNIIAKLQTRCLRDNILSAYRLKKGLISTDIGISGAPRTIYVNEHLTLQKKQLLRETRELAKKYEYKFVWIKHATILVKQSENSSTIAIKSSKDLCKVRPLSNNI